jgi:hypothetical protein
MMKFEMRFIRFCVAWYFYYFFEGFLVSLLFSSGFIFVYSFLLSALLRIHPFFPWLNQTGVLSRGPRPAVENNNKIGPRIWVLIILSILKWNCTELEVKLAVGHVA